MSDKPSYPVSTAVVSWIDSNGGAHLHVFSCDGYTVIERYTDPGTNGWATGALNQPGSSVSATAWTAGGSGSIRVYCTNDDGTIEWCSDAGAAWYQGAYTTQ